MATPEPLQIENCKYEDAFDLTGHGMFSHLVSIACSLVFVHAMWEMVAIAYIITPAECDLRLTVVEKSWVNAAVFIGMMVTSIPWGILGDKFGRRMVMLPALFGSVLASLASSLCSSFWFMFFFRLLTGIMVSASPALILVYLGELQIKKYRDRSISIATLMSQLSLVFAAVVAWVVIPQHFSFKIRSLTVRSWRVYMWLWSVIGLAGAGIIVILPESPRYVFAVKGPAKALPILAKIYAWNLRAKTTSYPVKSLVSETDERRRSLHRDIKQLLTAPLRRCVLLTHFVMFNCFVFASGLYIWVPDLLNAALSRASNYIGMCTLINQQYFSHEKKIMALFFVLVPHNDLSCQDSEVNWVVYPTFIVLELIGLIPFICVAVFINKYNKVKLAAVIMCICNASLIVSVVLPQSMVALTIFVIGLSTGCVDSILAALIVESFPTNLRGLTTCTLFMVGHLGAVVGTNLVAFLAGWTCYLLLPLAALVSAGSVIALIVCWPDVQNVRAVMEAKKYDY